MPINDRQQRFVDEYLLDLNATKAAERAGYRQPGNQGHRLLKNDDIRAAIDAAMAKRSDETGITAKRVLEELAKLGFASIEKYVDTSLGKPHIDFSALTADQLAAVAQIETEEVDVGDGPTILKAKFKLHDKLRALELIGKHLGMFKEVVDLNVTTDDVATVTARRKERARERLH